MLAAQVMGAQSLTGKSSFRICVTTRTGSAFKHFRGGPIQCPYMSRHSVLSTQEAGAYHFAIPLYHTTPKSIKKVGNTTKIPVNVRHWYGRSLLEGYANYRVISFSAWMTGASLLARDSSEGCKAGLGLDVEHQKMHFQRVFYRPLRPTTARTFGASSPSTCGAKTRSDFALRLYVVEQAMPRRQLQAPKRKLQRLRRPSSA